MNRNQKLTLVLTAVLTLGVGDAAAQDEERRRGPRGVSDSNWTTHRWTSWRRGGLSVSLG